MDAWNIIAQSEFKMSGVTVLHVNDDMSIKGKISKLLSSSCKDSLISLFSAKPSDTIVFLVGPTYDIVSYVF